MLLEKGLIWHIGNGRFVNLLTDNWIPRDSGLNPILGCQRRVEYFIQEDRSWNITMLEEYFLPVNVGVIKNILLSSDLFDDSLFWCFDSTGLFSVQSGYKLALDLAFSKEASSSAVTGFGKIKFGT